MMTTNLFIIANVKQLRTGGSFRILLPFFRTSWCVGVLNSAIFNSFHNRVEFGTILEGLLNFGGGGSWTSPTPNPLGTPLSYVTVTSMKPAEIPSAACDFLSPATVCTHDPTFHPLLCITLEGLLTSRFDWICMPWILEALEIRLETISGSAMNRSLYIGKGLC